MGSIPPLRKPFGKPKACQGELPSGACQQRDCLRFYTTGARRQESVKGSKPSRGKILHHARGRNRCRQSFTLLVGTPTDYTTSPSPSLVGGCPVAVLSRVARLTEGSKSANTKVAICATLRCFFCSGVPVFLYLGPSAIFITPMANPSPRKILDKERGETSSAPVP